MCPFKIALEPNGLAYENNKAMVESRRGPTCFVFFSFVLLDISCQQCEEQIFEL